MSEVTSISQRATTWAEFIGQTKVKESLQIAISAANARQHSLEHVLLYGPPGLGKTTIAGLVANSLKTNLHVTSGPALTRVGDLASILTQLTPGDVLFVDEIHRLNKAVEEALYPALEDFAFDMVVGKGAGARVMRLDLPHFTMVGATTKAGMLSSPLRDRFGLIERLNFYDDQELAAIIENAAARLKQNIDRDSALELAKRSRGTPRLALKLLKRVLDFSEVRHHQSPNQKITAEALSFYQVDEVGLDETDRKLLLAIIKDHNGGPVGLDTLSALIAEDLQTITDIYEPFLLQSGFLSRTPRGRMATPKAYTHLKIKARS